MLVMEACMYRYAIEKLYKWKEDKYRKPLIIEGARQVGKTWLMKEFGRQCYAKTAYVNFDRNPRMKQEFDQALGLAETAVQQAPDAANLWIILGQIYHQLNRFDDAVAAHFQDIDEPVFVPFEE